MTSRVRDEQTPRRHPTGNELSKPRPLTTDRPLWHQQPTETAKASTAFQVYKDMGPARSLAKVAAHIGKSVAMLQVWSRRWSWVRRAQAWDRHLAENRETAAISAEQAAVESHYKLGCGLVAKAARNLTVLPDQGLGANEIAKLARDGVAIEREALGLDSGTSKIEIRVVVQFIEHLQDVLRAELADRPDTLARIANRISRMVPDPPEANGHR